MKDKIITITFVCYLCLFSGFHIFMPDKEISVSERRLLNKFPKFTISSEFIKDVDKYMLDNFPFRDNFRNIKAVYNYNFLQKLDNNSVFIKDNYIFKSDFPLNEKSVQNFKVKINQLKNLLSSNNRVFMLVIPDKNYYLSESDFLHINYDYIYETIKDINIKQIDVRNILKLNDYYETDTHWRQENLDKVVKDLDKVMNFDYKKINYKKNVYENFYGVFYGQSALKRKPEKLYYLTNDILNKVVVNYLENKNLNKVYNIQKLNGLDAYDVYLDGASSFIEIYNENASSSKELIIFRDSFGSSLAPLLVNYYSKITLIDNRYIDSNNFLKLIDFKNQDVLFLYSTLLINNSFTLKG